MILIERVQDVEKVCINMRSSFPNDALGGRTTPPIYPMAYLRSSSTRYDIPSIS